MTGTAARYRRQDMSGPKYYDFQMKNAEEAAAILAQLSTFRPGVKVEVVNNQLKFIVNIQL